MANRQEIEEYYLRPVGLRVCCTSDVPDTVLRQVFLANGWEDLVDIDGDRVALMSAEPPSFVQLLATLEWWQGLASAAAGVVVTGYLEQAGINLWKNQRKIGSLISKRLWSLADRIVNLQTLLPERTSVSIAFPSRDYHFPVLLLVRSLDIETVALQIATLVYYSGKIERFLQSNNINSVMNPIINISEKGTLELHWRERVGNEAELRFFHFDDTAIK